MFFDLQLPEGKEMALSLILIEFLELNNRFYISKHHIWQYLR